MNIEIPEYDYAMWKKDPVTLAVFHYLESIADYSREQMTSRELVSNPNGLLRLNEIRGYITAIEDIVNMHASEPEIEDSREDI